MSDKRIPLVISHASCMDGLFAAAVAYDFFDGACDIQYEHYHRLGERFASFDLDNRDVYLLDISISPEFITDEIVDRVRKIVILDHHKTHYVNWGLSREEGARETLVQIFDTEKRVFSKRHDRDLVRVHYSPEMSGAELAYRYFWGSDDGSSYQRHLPLLLAFISDRDRWKFELPDSRAIHEWLLYEGLLSGNELDALAVMKTFQQEPEYRMEKLMIGHTLLNHTRAYVKGIAKNQRMVRFMEHTVPLVPCPKAFTAEVGELLGNDHPFVMTYYDNLVKGIREYSLRSKPASGFDVEVLAKRMGGGGHASAAGFTMLLSDTVTSSIMQYVD